MPHSHLRLHMEGVEVDAAMRPRRRSDQPGAGDNQKDVTELLRKQAGDLPLISLPADGYNASFGDPAEGTPKTLMIQYKINGKPGEATFAENALIILPTPK